MDKIQLSLTRSDASLIATALMHYSGKVIGNREAILDAVDMIGLFDEDGEIGEILQYYQRRARDCRNLVQLIDRTITK